MSACTCSPCGRRFTSVTSFDAHQDVDYGRRPAVVCRDPASLGMKPDQHGRWRVPATDRELGRLYMMKARQVA